MSLSFDFSELLGLQKLHFPLKPYMEECFWLSLAEDFFILFIYLFIYLFICFYLFWRTFFPRSFFLRPRRKYTKKNPAESYSMKIQVKSGETPVRKNAGKIIQNVDCRRLTLKSTKLTCCPILKIQSQ